MWTMAQISIMLRFRVVSDAWFRLFLCFYGWVSGTISFAIYIGKDTSFIWVVVVVVAVAVAVVAVVLAASVVVAVAASRVE
jgi:hypothetical protein